MDFEIIGEITQIETIARGKGAETVFDCNGSTEKVGGVS